MQQLKKISILFLLPFLLWNCVETIAPPSTEGIVGQLEPQENLPIENVEVVIVDKNTGVIIAKEITDSEGKFEFDQLESGSYNIEIRYPDPITNPPLIISNIEYDGTKIILDQQTINNQSSVNLPNGISGIIISPRGEILRGAEITLTSLKNPSLVLKDTTNDNGYYEFVDPELNQFQFMATYEKNGESFGLLLPNNIYQNQLVDRLHDTLKVNGSISISINEGDKRIENTECEISKINVMLDSKLGQCQIFNIPPGTYDIKYSNGEYNIESDIGIDVLAGEISIINNNSAVKNVIPYNIEIFSEIGGSTNLEGKFEKSPGTVVEIEATPDTSWIFDRWITTTQEFELDNPTNPSINIKVVQSFNLKATFLPLVNMEIIKEGNGTVIGIEGKMLADSSYSISATAAEDWGFVGWEILSGEGNLLNGNDPNTQIVVKSNIIVRAIFSKHIDYLYTSVEGLGTINLKDTNKVNLGSEYNLIATPQKNWEFYKWKFFYGKARIMDMDANSTSISIDSTTSICAQFIKSKSFVQLIVKGEGAVTPKIADVKIGDTLNITATPGENYRFKNWIIKTGGDTSQLLSPNSSSSKLIVSQTDMVVEAEFVVNPKLTINIVGEGTTSPNYAVAKYVPYNENFKIMALPDSNSYFKNWVKDEGGVIIDDTNNVNSMFRLTSNGVITVCFSRNPVSFSFTTVGTGAPFADQKNNIVPGDSIRIWADVYSGNYFYKWTVTKGEAIIVDPTAAETKVILNSHAEIQIEFKPYWALDMDLLGTGNVWASKRDSIKSEDTVMIAGIKTNFWHDHYRWVLKSGAATILDTNADTTYAILHGDANIEGRFYMARAIITVDLWDNGSGTTNHGLKDTIPTHVPVQFIAIPNLGQLKEKWVEKSSNASISDLLSDTTYVTITNHATIELDFDPAPKPKLTNSSNNKDLGTVSQDGTHSLDFGKTYTLVATEKSGTFSYWNIISGAANIQFKELTTISDKEIKITIDGNVTLQGIFNPTPLPDPIPLPVDTLN